MQKTIYILIAFLLLQACSNNPNKHVDKDYNHSTTIELNQGKKWKVNPEMKPHIEKGNTILQDYISNKNTDYKTLAENLKAQNDQLIKSCTMKGESHNQLHKWLHPHIELIKKLKESKNGEEANDVINELKNSFATYHQYFE